MMKTIHEIVGDVFIIPNPTVNFTRWIDSLSRVSGYNLKYWSYYASMIPDGVDFETSKPVQVWIVTRGNSESNWHAHGIDGFDGELDGWYPATENIPSEIFEGKKEGDTVTFEMPICTRPWIRDECNGIQKIASIKVSLTLAQLKYRYRDWGPFENALKQI